MDVSVPIQSKPSRHRNYSTSQLRGEASWRINPLQLGRSVAEFNAGLWELERQKRTSMPTVCGLCTHQALCIKSRGCAAEPAYKVRACCAKASAAGRRDILIINRINFLALPLFATVQFPKSLTPD
jgi:hypothetical protein